LLNLSLCCISIVLVLLEIYMSVSDLINIQRNSINMFFDKLDPTIIEEITLKIIEKNKAGNVIYWSGVGKSYNVALHSADMLKSMGFASFAIKPIEALHGDIGAIKNGDLIFVFSKSGNTQELLPFMAHLNKLDIEVYGIFCNSNAMLTKYCHRVIILPCGEELDNGFDLVPTTSIVSFVLFCNLIVCYFLKVQNVNIYEYAKNHPSGNIGLRVWSTVGDIMYPIDDICVIKESTTLLECMMAMTTKRTGYAIVVGDTSDNILIGIVSDGDIRRYLTRNETHPTIDLNVSIMPLINIHPTTILDTSWLRDAIELISKNRELSIGMPVINNKGQFVGFIDNKLLVKWGAIF
jgi:arabinose-5-phosphate isomerase